MNRAFFAMLPAISAVVFASGAALVDLRTRRIPNRLILFAFAVALITQFAARGWAGVASAFLAAGIASALMSLGYLLGGVGAGDVKLLGAMGAFAGTSAVALLLISTSLAGGLLGLLLIGRNAYAMRLFRRRDHHKSPSPSPHTLTLPYGVPIGCGTLAVLWHMLWRAA